MRILVSGASGFIGSALVPNLRAQNHEVIPLHRRTIGSVAPPWWDPARGTIDLGPNARFDTIIHLAGENIVGRWTQQKKERLYKSRVDATKLLVDAVRTLPAKPASFICASAIGFYGICGTEWVDESSSSGTGFLADICRAWEQMASSLSDVGVRVVFLRFGVVFGTRGGALKKMLPVFRFGLGGRLGGGSQYWSWIAVDDVVTAITFVLNDSTIAGPVNFTAPQPATNAEFTSTLARVLRRPAVFPVPKIALRLAFGREMADETFLASVRVRPRVLQQHGYQFGFPDLEPALRHLLANR